MHGLAEGGSAIVTGFPFVLLHQATLHASLAGHRHPWIIRVYEHTFPPIIDLKSSFAG
jgi:hypothetical protein